MLARLERKIPQQSPSEREQLLSVAAKSAVEPDLTIDTEDIMKMEELIEALRNVISEENKLSSPRCSKRSPSFLRLRPKLFA
jgi:hypothetical protein